MASLVPTIAPALISSGVSLVRNEISRQTNRVGRNQALEQLQERQALEQRQAAQNAALDRERLTVETQNAEEERQRALRRAVARQRASFGAQGLSGTGGSSQAVLLGLFEESDEDRTQRERLDNIRNRAIDQGLSQGRSLNVLQRTQLEERNRLNTLSGFGATFGDGLNIAAKALEESS